MYTLDRMIMICNNEMAKQVICAKNSLAAPDTDT